MRTVDELSPVIYIEISSGKDLLTASMDGRNNYIDLIGYSVHMLPYVEEVLKKCELQVQVSNAQKHSTGLCVCRVCLCWDNSNSNSGGWEVSGTIPSLAKAEQRVQQRTYRGLYSSHTLLRHAAHCSILDAPMHTLWGSSAETLLSYSGIYFIWMCCLNHVQSLTYT